MVALAEEIDTPGEGQIRAMITVAGNPVLSTPDSDRLDAALASLDFMVAVDIYVNETTRHADVILPAPSALQKSHYDVALLQLAVRNVANYSPAGPAPRRRPARRVGDPVHAGRRSSRASGRPRPTPPWSTSWPCAAWSSPRSPTSTARSTAATPTSCSPRSAPRVGPDRMLDFMLRVGPYGDAFGARPDGLTLGVLEDHPHGVDLGPLQPRMPEVLRQPDGMIDAAPEALVADLTGRLVPTLDEPTDGLLLIGRRHLRSNNSWMHNVKVLVKGKPRCTLQIHPDDAGRRGVTDGGQAEVRSRTGAVVVPVEVTDSVMPGVVSIPHGWGHDLDGVRLSIAAEHAGVNANVLADTELFDVVSGTAVLNGIPVEVAPA